VTLFICLRTKLADELLINLNLSLHAVKMKRSKLVIEFEQRQ